MDNTRQMAARILIVEDDKALLSTLRDILKLEGYATDAAATGADAVALFNDHSFNLVLLDLHLPDAEEGELLGKLRSLSDIPILVVSGMNSEADRIAALDAGADDFVSKPFLPGELLARIRAALRRYAPIAEESERRPITVGAFSLDPLDRTASFAGNVTQLGEVEHKVLRMLVAAPGDLVSKAAILEMLYGDEPNPETKIVDVYMSRLRHKLRDISEGRDFIANVRGQGWRFDVGAAQA